MHSRLCFNKECCHGEIILRYSFIMLNMIAVHRMMMVYVIFSFLFFKQLSCEKVKGFNPKVFHESMFRRLRIRVWGNSGGRSNLSCHCFQSHRDVDQTIIKEPSLGFYFIRTHGLPQVKLVGAACFILHFGICPSSPYVKGTTLTIVLGLQMLSWNSFHL